MTHKRTGTFSKMTRINFLLVAVLILCLGSHQAIEIDEELFMQLVSRVDNLELRNRDLEARNAALEKNVNLGSANKRLVMSSGEGPVAFTSRIDRRYVDHVVPQQTIVFPNTVTDIGGGYNNATGVFVAPLSGIYIFSCSLIDHFERADGTGSQLHAEIVHEGTALARVFAHSAGSIYRDQGANTVFVTVQQGESVWVRSIDNPDLKLGGDLYSTFSGYMLWQM